MKFARILMAMMASLGLQAAHGWGGDLVNNGGGLAEKNVLYAYEKIDKYLQYCVTSSVCKLTDAQKVIAQKIYNGLPQEKAAGNQLQYISEQKVPGSFMIDGNIRIAKTGSTIGSPIVINTDMLYNKVGDTYEALTMPEAVAVLVHEFGHHYGSYTHEELDLIGVRVSMMMQQKMITTPMLPWNSFASASVFNSKLRTDFPQVLLSVGTDLVDISEIYRRTVHCEVFTLPIPVLPIPDLELVTREPVGSMLHNIHWEKIKEKDDQISVKIIGNVSNTCTYKSNLEVRDNNYQISISFTAKRAGDSWSFVSNSLSLTQFKDPWWKIIKLPGTNP
jgi:hypothetical protein